MRTVEEGYELHNKIKTNNAYFEYYHLDPICMCLFEDYNVGDIGGYQQRERIGITEVYKALERVESFEDFEVLIARLKLELHV